MEDSNDIRDPGQSPAATAAEPSELQRQRDEYYDLLLRKSAEFDNYRKRIERERQSFAEATTADILTEFLPLMDDLDRALAVEALPGAADAYRKGVELIHRQLSEILHKRGVRPIDALGAEFDPHRHEAISYDAAEGRKDGEIIEDFRRGYTLGDRLLRASTVRVARG